MYACAAATEEGARCRNMVVEVVGEMCHLHKGGKVAPRPDIILVKFNLNPKWAEKFERLGVPRKSSLSFLKENAHARQAEKLGRDPYRYGRPVADSGVPVFGKQGIQEVSLFDLLKELLDRYKITDIHLRPRRDEKMDVLVVSLMVSLSPGEEVVLSSSASQELLSFLAVSCWGYCHVWANPPSDDGRIVHTVHSSHRAPDSKPRVRLRFFDGLWAVEPVP